MSDTPRTRDILIDDLIATKKAVRRLDLETLQRWRHQGAVDPQCRLAMFSAEWQHLIDLAIAGLNAAQQMPAESGVLNQSAAVAQDCGLRGANAASPNQQRCDCPCKDDCDEAGECLKAMGMGCGGSWL